MNFKKDKFYYNQQRTDLLFLLPREIKFNNVLEIGCGNGRTGQLIKQLNKATNVFGIEINEALKIEAEKKLDKVIIGDIEKMELPFDIEYFDCIILADVLEHLYDPWYVVKKLKPFLKTDGVVLASFPNVQHWSILINLLRGKWDYKSEGLLDDTHIRFFTKSSMSKMFEDAGLEIIKINRNMGRMTRFINTMSFCLFNNFFSFRYLILASKKTVSY